MCSSSTRKYSTIDTHWIWQDGQALCDVPLLIHEGVINIPDRPGLGIEINMDKLLAAHELYQRMDPKYRDRDDSIAMQYLIKDWKFDSKKPCLVR